MTHDTRTDAMGRNRTEEHWGDRAVRVAGQRADHEHVAELDALYLALTADHIALADRAHAAEVRIAALDAAAREVVDWATVADAIAGYPACRCCGRVIDGWDTHRHADCAMGTLAALLEEDAHVGGP